MLSESSRLVVACLSLARSRESEPVLLSTAMAATLSRSLLRSRANYNVGINGKLIWRISNENTSFSDVATRSIPGITQHSHRASCVDYNI